MTIIGFNFRKIIAERGSSTAEKINIANNVSVKQVEEAKVPMSSKTQKALRFSYEFTTKYEPKMGSIIIEGDVIYLASEEIVDNTLKSWKKDKKIGKEILTPLLNTILTKCSIKGLLLSQDLNLPSPMQLPRVTVK